MEERNRQWYRETPHAHMRGATLVRKQLENLEDALDLKNQRIRRKDMTPEEVLVDRVDVLEKHVLFLDTWRFELLKSLESFKGSVRLLDAFAEIAKDQLHDLEASNTGGP